MKRCERCILRQFDRGDYKCDGDMRAPDCIGRLQGVIETLKFGSINTARTADPEATNVRVDYAISGEGSFYVPYGTTDDDIFSTIVQDCSEKEISFEYF